MTNPTEGANKDHNVADIKTLIRDCASEMNDIDDERKELNERAGEIRKRLKDSGVQIEAFQFARKLDKMEPEARDDYLDSLRINMESMGIGGQGTLFIDEGHSAEATHDVNAPEDQTTH